MLDLYHASREELPRLLLAQRETIARQEAQLARQQGQVAELQATTAQLAQRVGELAATDRRLAERVRELEGRPGGKPRGRAGNKLVPEPPAAPKRPRKERAHNAGRPRMTPTARVVHALDACPDCGRGLCGGTVARTRAVIETPFVRAEVTEHVYLARRCPRCKKAWAPREDLAGVVVGQQRLGIGLVSPIATPREAGRWPFATIRWYLATCHQLHLSVAALVGALQQLVAHGRGFLEQLRERIRGSPVVHADETGWREDGRNGYAWTFCTPTVRYFLRRGRHKEVVDEVLGARFSGVLVSAFYGAYGHDPGVKQRCWAPLPRDIHELRGQHPTDAALRGWAAGVHDRYTRAKAYRGATAQERRRAQRACARELLACRRPCVQDAAAPQATLRRRIEAHVSEPFAFVADPAVPPGNNAAERSLRHLATGRKIGGGPRAAAGSAVRMVPASFFGTRRAEGRDPSLACRQLLAQPPLPRLAPQM